MSLNLKNNYTKENILYNNILSLSRNKLFYTKFNLTDTFQNRIYLIFIHISFLLMKIKEGKNGKKYKIFYQKIFDLIFKKIEINMREIGHGDTIINKNMKFLVKSFYSILLDCENLSEKSQNSKKIILFKYLELTKTEKKANNDDLVEYFDKYKSFCFDLSLDNVLQGEINFIYK
jgi:cytochrome b pre-mRNA-processing protein 3